jgi:preprotein translocase subunit SecD
MNQGKKLKKKSSNVPVNVPVEPVKKKKSKVPVNVPIEPVKKTKSKVPVEPVNSPKPVIPTEPVKAPKVLSVKATRKKMNLRGIIDDMMRERPTQNNFEDLYKLEGFDLYRHQYKRDKRL